MNVGRSDNECKIGGLIFNAKESQKDVDLYSTKDFFGDSEKIEKRKLDVDRKTWYYALRAKPDSDEKNKLVLNKIHDEIISEIKAVQWGSNFSYRWKFYIYAGNNCRR